MASEISTSTSLPLSTASAYSFVSRYLAPFSVVVLVASLFSTGLIAFELFTLSVTSWDLAIILLAVTAALLFLLGDRRLPRVSRLVVALASVFGLWVFIEALRSPQEFRGLTMAVLMLRNYVMAFSLLVILDKSVSITWLNRSMFLTGIFMAAVAIVMFLPRTEVVTVHERRPYGSIIVLFDEFTVPRLMGFVNDPNFFALAALMAVFFLFAFERSRATLLIGLGTAVVFASVFLTFSRSGYAAMLAGLLAVLFLALIQRELLNRRRVLLNFVLLLSVSVLTFVAVARVELNLGRTVWDVTALRFDRILDSPRFTLWRTLIEDPDGPEPIPSAVAEPTATPAPDPTATPESQPTATPEPDPTATPAPDPTATPESQPTATPEPDPTVGPTAVATITPRGDPDAEPAESEQSSNWATVFGNGLRANEVRLNSYSHSSYLDVSQEMGIVGATIWGTIAVLVGLTLVRHGRTNPAAAPWLPALAVVLVMMGSLSMLFMPYFWLVAAVAIRFLSVRTAPHEAAVKQQPERSSDL